MSVIAGCDCICAVMSEIARSFTNVCNCVIMYDHSGKWARQYSVVRGERRRKVSQLLDKKTRFLRVQAALKSALKEAMKTYSPASMSFSSALCPRDISSCGNSLRSCTYPQKVETDADHLRDNESDMPDVNAPFIRTLRGLLSYVIHDEHEQNDTRRLCLILMLLE